MRGHYIYVPLDQATNPAEGHAYINRWWTVHPEKGVVFYVQSINRIWFDGEPVEPSPQCNGVEATSRILTQRLRPECEVQFIPVVFARHAWLELVRLNKAAKEGATP